MNKYFFLIMLSSFFTQAQTNESTKTLYIYRPLINGDDLHSWAKEQGLKILAEDALHVTLAYSRGGVENGT
jgi:hypothetical protein